MANSRQSERFEKSLPATGIEGRPGDFQLGSIESRAAARALVASMSDPEPFKVTIVHIGHDGATPLPPPTVIKWDGGTTEIMHVAG